MSLCSTLDCGSPVYALALCACCYRHDYYMKHAAQAKAGSKKWRHENPEQAAETLKKRRVFIGRPPTDPVKRRAYYDAHVEEIRAYSKAYYALNRERMIAATRSWIAANPDRWRIIQRETQQRRRARIGDQKVASAEYEAMIEEFGMICHICGGEIPGLEQLHFDHVIPLARGGRHAIENIRPSHAHCNLSKGAELLP